MQDHQQRTTGRMCDGNVRCLLQAWLCAARRCLPPLVVPPALALQEEHHPVTASVTGVNVLVELATPAVGGISENDFIVAAKVNQLSLTDLEAKKKARYWA